MLKTSASILEQLNLLCHLLELCTGDMSFGSKRTIDIEAWLPSENSYREISSVSVMGDFQARRMKTRFISDNKEKVIPFTYNGSALAIDRTIVAIVENFIDLKTNIIKIPKVLHKYLSFTEI